MIKAGYIVHSELKNTTDEDARKLDVINIAFAHCRNARFFFEHEEDLAGLGRLRRANPALRILFSVGGWGSGGFSTMAASREGRERFAASCLDAVKRYRLDGIDIDWEYPGLDWAGIDASPDDKVNFTLLLAAMRERFDRYDKNLMLTAAVGCDRYFLENTEMEKAAPLLDYVSVMTYDMRGCQDRITGHHTNLFAPDKPDLFRSYRSVDYSVRLYHEGGVPLDKLVIGLAFYSRMWEDVSSQEENGLWQMSGPGNYGPSFGLLADRYINQNGFIRYWDDRCQAPYLFDGRTLISYDDEQSIAAKCRYAAEKGLRGLMYWEHSCDPGRRLLDTLFRCVPDPAALS